ncbi:MAG: hypothetical protein ABIU09_04925 [Pyrinomonadaceae bacterium]
MSKYTNEFEGITEHGRSARSDSVDRAYSPSSIFNGGETEGLDSFVEPAKKGPFIQVLKIFAIVLIVILAVGGIGGYLYWRSLQGTPQYSLALLIEAARSGDPKAVETLIDTDAAVDNFVPQVTAKAVELYGRGLPPETITRIERLAAPLMPAVKDRARAELPRLIREKTARFESVPFAGMVLGADRYLEIETNGSDATVKSKLPEHGFEVLMTKNGDKWKIVGVRDEKLATTIAQKIGQDVIAVANNGGTRSARFKDFQDIMKQAQDIFR